LLDGDGRRGEFFVDRDRLVVAAVGSQYGRQIYGQIGGQQQTRLEFFEHERRAGFPG